MGFDPADGTAILRRTPGVLDSLLGDLDSGWTELDEGHDSWSPYDIVGHLIHGERTDWIPRARRILEHGPARPFEPFDRFAQFEESRGKTVRQLLDEFARLRRGNLETLQALDLGPRELALEGTHPELGRVTLGELLATWVVHDLGHIAQIARVMAKRYSREVGPWTAYLPVLSARRE